jgi:hypothetical protein
VSVAEALRNIHPDAVILSVETDLHEHRDTCRCEICLQRIVPWDDSLCDGDGNTLATVARIMVIAPGYDPEGELLSDGSDWPVICRACIREALDLLRDRVMARPVSDATVSARAAELRAIDEAFDDLARAS